MHPGYDWAGYHQASRRLEHQADDRWTNDLLIVGGSWSAAGQRHVDDQFPIAGLIGEYAGRMPHDGGEATIHSWDNAGWVTCGHCRQPGVFAENYSWTVRPCGDYDGGGNLQAPEGLGDDWLATLSNVTSQQVP